MTRIKKTVSKAVEILVFDIISPLGCIAVKGGKGLREVISRRREEKERRQKEAASENKEERK